MRQQRNHYQRLTGAEHRARVEIVINADAVAAAIDKPHATDPYLRVCANTLANKNIAAPDKLKQVPAAVVYIAQRQRDGWAYMRA